MASRRKRSGSRRQLLSVLCGQQPARAIFDAQRGENPREISASVDRDAIAPLIYVRNDRVAVHDDPAMLLGVAEERLADPAQVHARLLVNPHSPPDAGL